MKNFQVHKNFFSDAKKLRSEFDQQFQDARSTDNKRFVWDYWFFENQYHHLRTPALYYFTKNIYQDFHSQLVQWGRENLGCHDISPPWLSYYVDGCYQNMHSDVPHGPWAYVYSLTIDPKKFSGGETFILKPDVLDYWPNFQDANNREYKSFFDIIPANFNQLTVFDPRYPHGVTELKGSRDPQKGRLVMHGWFVEPRPYVTGGLTTAQVQKQLTPALINFAEILKSLNPIHGVTSLKLSVSASGEIKNIQEMTSTLISLNHENGEVIHLRKFIKSIFGQLKFPKTNKASVIVVPLLFK